MTSPMLYSAEAYRLINEFNEALELNATIENCFGKNGLGETVPFTTNEFLTDYWTRENITRLLRNLSKTDYVPYDISLILSDYIIVFSILVKLQKPDWIRQFMAEQITNTLLPLRRGNFNMPKSWTDQPHMKDLWNGFINEQWRFCPYLFERISNAELPESRILPIQEKIPLKKGSHEGDMAILYKVKLHPICRETFSEYIVFKEYQRSDSIAATAYDNEISIYTALKQRSTAFTNIIEYYGSFQIFGKRTIMLEYADGGDLLTFFKEVDRPSEAAYLTAFWTNFFQLLLGLAAIHNLEYPDGDEDKWLLEGMHQDIRPQNVVLIKKRSSGHPYDVTFKLLDFGTGFAKKQSQDKLRGRHQDNLGNAIYSSPESFHDRLHPESDVWALGALASEALVWSIAGWNGVQRYFNLRALETVQELKETHHACFHDGIVRLSIIEDQHREILKDKREEDRISSVVSQMILDHMLIEFPRQLEARPSTNTPQRRGSRQTHQIWRRMFSELFPTSDPQLHDLRSRPQFSATEPTLPVVPTESFPQSFEVNTAGATTLDRYVTTSSRISDDPRHSSHRNFGSPLHGRHSVNYGPRQIQPGRNSFWQSEDSLEAESTRLAISRPDRSSIVRNLMGQLDRTTGATDTQHDPPRFDNDPVTIGTIYDKFIAPKDAKNMVEAAFLRLRRSSNDQNDPLKVHPGLGRAVSKLKNSGSSGREQVFLVDDSKSMRRFQKSIARTVRVLTYLIKIGDVDPDRSIELYFATEIGRKTESSRSKPLEDAINKWKFDDSVCEMETALETLLLSVLPKRPTQDPKPVSVYVLTNGFWSDDNPTSLCGVDEAIEKALRHLETTHAQLGKKWLGIQFIGFFDFDPTSVAENKIGRRRLEFLDDKLGELFEALDLRFTRKDIVDTRVWTDDVKDILLGAVSNVVDRKENDQRRFDYRLPRSLHT